MSDKNIAPEKISGEIIHTFEIFPFHFLRHNWELPTGQLQLKKLAENLTLIYTNLGGAETKRNNFIAYGQWLFQRQNASKKTEFFLKIQNLSLILTTRILINELIRLGFDKNLLTTDTNNYIKKPFSNLKETEVLELSSKLSNNVKKIMSLLVIDKLFNGSKKLEEVLPKTLYTLARDEDNKFIASEKITNAYNLLAKINEEMEKKLGKIVVLKEVIHKLIVDKKEIIDSILKSPELVELRKVVEDTKADYVEKLITYEEHQRKLYGEDKNSPGLLHFLNDALKNEDTAKIAAALHYQENGNVTRKQLLEVLTEQCTPFSIKELMEKKEKELNEAQAKKLKAALTYSNLFEKLQERSRRIEIIENSKVTYKKEYKKELKDIKENLMTLSENLKPIGLQFCKALKQKLNEHNNQ